MLFAVTYAVVGISKTARQQRRAMCFVSHTCFASRLYQIHRIMVWTEPDLLAAKNSIFSPQDYLFVEIEAGFKHERR